MLVPKPFLFSFVMDNWAFYIYIQGKVPWCMLFEDEIFLIYETHNKVNDRLEV